MIISTDFFLHLPKNLWHLCGESLLTQCVGGSTMEITIACLSGKQFICYISPCTG